MDGSSEKTVFGRWSIARSSQIGLICGDPLGLAIEPAVMGVPIRIHDEGSASTRYRVLRNPGSPECGLWLSLQSIGTSCAITVRAETECTTFYRRLLSCVVQPQLGQWAGAGRSAEVGSSGISSVLQDIPSSKPIRSETKMKPNGRSILPDGRDMQAGLKM
jgi:hypothetical protein